jgi:hypothetical protein
MGTEKGFVLTPRHFYESDIWLDPSPYDVRSAWQDLIRRAQWHQSKRLRSWEQIILERGDLIVSIKNLAETWKWSHGKVERYIAYLEKTERIRRAKRHNFSVITICNYDKYQNLDNYMNGEMESKREPNGNQTETERPPDDYIQDNKDNKDKEDSNVLPPDKSAGRTRYTKDGLPITNDLADDIVEFYKSHSLLPEEKIKSRKYAMGMLVQTTVADLKSAIESFWFVVRSPDHQDFTGAGIARFCNETWKQFLPVADPLNVKLKLEVKDGKRARKSEKPNWEVL